jgi:glycosyltransferase involved in cell wall biosynthesis
MSLAFGVSFWKLWLEGRLIEAGKQFLLGYSYQKKISNNPDLEDYYFFFFHSLFFASPTYTLKACQELKKMISCGDPLPFLKQQVLDVLEREELALILIHHSKTQFQWTPKLLSNTHTLDNLRMLYGKEVCSDHGLVSYMQSQRLWFANQQSLLNKKPFLSSHLRENYHSFLAWEEHHHVFIESRIFKGRFPVFLMGPVDLDWSIIGNAPCCFLFVDYLSFCHCLQFSSLAKVLEKSKSLIIFLDSYFYEQAFYQNFEIMQERELEVINVCPNYFSENKSKEIKELLGMLLSESKESEIWKKSKSADNFFLLGNTLRSSLEWKRLPKRSGAAFTMIQESQYWWSWHQEVDCRQGSIFLREMIQELPKPVLLKKSSEKSTVLHVIPRFVDEGHAPSIRIYELLKHYNFDQFKVLLLIVDQHLFRREEYPYFFSDDSSSKQRGYLKIKELEGQGVEVFHLQKEGSFLSLAEEKAKEFKGFGVDLAIFHDPNEWMYLFAHQMEGVHRVFFEHGSLPKLHFFESIILNHEYEADCLRKKSLRNVYFNPLSIDLLKNEKTSVISRHKWGFSSKDVLITTVSNSLVARLSSDFCCCIAKILQACKQAIFLPVGFVINKDKNKIMSIFKDYGVEDQVVFLGQLEPPLSFLKEMDLYFNDFPVGGGLAILEAMAAQLPVLCLFDESSHLRSRQASLYMERDQNFVVSSCSEYINRGIELVKNSKERELLSKESYKKYQRRSLEEDYILRHQKIVNQLLTYQKVLNYV